MTKMEALQILGLTGEVTKKDIKLAYKRKAKEFHPDRNPMGADIMKMINVAYELVKDEEHIDIVLEEGTTVSDYPEVISKALNAIIDFDLDIEVCGLWVWVSGDTKPYKETLKAAGFLWAFKKKMWFFRPPQAKRRNWRKPEGEWSMDQIRDKYKSDKVGKSGRQSKQKRSIAYSS